jgi:predicted Fe-Mo cluster-binding NifX family protein
LFEADGTFHCALDNRESDAMAHGAGLAAVQRLAQAGVKTVVTGQVGPKATAALAAAHMLVIDNCAEPTAKAAAQTALAAMAHS